MDERPDLTGARGARGKGQAYELPGDERDARRPAEGVARRRGFATPADL
ncbi:hypothetical protein ACFFV7_19790 [Nonomuraea spiralis]|uniref:Uncharacterized protein n=1 Tax=Nonomuraea spiralis TaxID=46182 RepID=A0ABV5IFX2_9ACTN|nr:hypothetical protein [Nonomuraea spiralis]